MKCRIISGIAILGTALTCFGAGKLEIHGSAEKATGSDDFVCRATVLDSASGEVLIQKDLRARVGQPGQDVSGTSDKSKSGVEDHVSCSISKDGSTADILYRKVTYRNSKPDKIDDYETQVPVR